MRECETSPNGEHGPAWYDRTKPGFCQYCGKAQTKEGGSTNCGNSDSKEHCLCFFGTTCFDGRSGECCDCGAHTEKPLELVVRCVHQWQPIETAPRDGTPVLFIRHAGDSPILTAMQRQYAVGNRSNHAWRMFWPVDAENHLEPTHWMPLPQPPGLVTEPPAHTLNAGKECRVVDGVESCRDITPTGRGPWVPVGIDAPPICDNCGSRNLSLRAKAYGEDFRAIACRDCQAVQMLGEETP